MRSVSIRQLDMKQATIPLGFEGENEFTEVRIDCKKTFDQHPDAVPSMTVTDPAGNKYPAVVTRDGDVVVWQLAAGDLTTKGYGEIQIEFLIDGTVIGKTDIARTRIERSIFPEGEAPEPVQNWVTHANETLAEVEEAIPAGGTTGQVLAKRTDADRDLEWVDQTGGGGGTTNYNQLTNKPQIGGVELSGNKTLHDLGAAAEGDIPDVSGFYTKPQTGIPASDIANGVIPDVSGFYTKPQGGIPASDIDPSAIPSPTSIIDDNAGEGDTNKVLSADKVTEITDGLKEAITNISETETVTSENILNPALINTGTVKTVVITRNDDVFTYNGTATGVDSILSESIAALEPGKTYTIKAYTKSTVGINLQVISKNGNTTLQTIICRDANAKNSTNTPYTFTVPAEATTTQIKLGVLAFTPAKAYSNETYKLSIQEGTTNATYKKYGTVSALTAIDNVARESIEQMESAISRICYVSTTGSDKNDGTAEHPFATFQHAIDAGYKRIIAAPGEYKDQQIIMSGLNGVSIISNSNTTEVTPFESHVRRTRAKLDNSIDIGELSAYNSIYRAALEVDSDSSYYKVFVSQEVDPVYSGANYYGRVTTYNAILWELTGDILTCTRLVPKLSLADCESTQGSFHYDGDYIYINPTGGSITGKTYKRLNLDTNQYGIDIRNCTDVYIQGIDAAFFPYYDVYFGHCENVMMKDCCNTFTCYGNAVELNGADATFVSCLSAQAGADGFGIAGYGDSSFYDCSAIKCYDDGISHHDASTGVIDGGEWSYCLKGGVTPSYGSNVSVKNVYCHHNLYGIYFVQTDDRITDKAMTLHNSLAVDNTRKDIRITGYDVVSHGCSYETKGVDSGATLTEYGNTVIT